MKQTATETLDIFFENKPQRNGAKNEPASAPQETDIRVVMYAFLFIARITEKARKTIIRTRIINTCFLSSISFLKGLIISIVIVELEVRTREESVDIEAESTSTIRTPKRISGSASFIINGTIASYSSFPDVAFLIVSASV